MTGAGTWWRQSAGELAAALAAGETTAAALLDGALDRIRHLNPDINAVVLIDEAGARRAAEASDARRQAGAALGPLDGLPITIKDNIYVGGLPATWGSALYRDFTPPGDDLPVARLRDAGAVIVGKTNTPEFAMLPVTENKLFGVTRNPWDLSLTPGGSSGGAVASVAAGLTPLAIGTDAGGSIRRPAGYAGVAGIRPTTGRVARDLGFPAIAQDFQAIGPMARTVGDLILALSCIARPSATDRLSLAFPPFDMNRAAFSGPNGKAVIRFVPRAGSGPVEAAVADSLRRAADTFADLGHDVTEADAPYDPEEIDRIWALMIGVGMGRVVDGVEDWETKVDDGIRGVIERASEVSAGDYLRTLDRIQELRADFARWMTGVDAMLTPASATLPWPAERRFPETVDGAPAGPRAAAAFATFVNAVGHPAISIPGDPAPTGLPIGVQLVGRFGHDEDLLALALEFEAAKPWRDRWPTLALA
ncbi:MAG: hypothetical protein CMM61_14760 [Rhodospirillaceae bacterium]|nr:hypothetical protein [Rhodospirillaceae bacterium]